MKTWLKVAVTTFIIYSVIVIGLNFIDLLEEEDKYKETVKIIVAGLLSLSVITILAQRKYTKAQEKYIETKEMQLVNREMVIKEQKEAIVEATDLLNKMYEKEKNKQQ